MAEVNQQRNAIQRHKIYGVSLASMIESIVFLSLYIRLINDTSYEISHLESWHPLRLDFASILNLSVIMVAIYILRIFLALVLLKKSFGVTIVFYIAVIVGIIINAITGLKAMSFAISHALGVATLFIIATHIVYLILIYSVIKQMRANSTTLAPRHSNPPTGQNPHNGFGQGPYPPYTIDISKTNIDSYPMQNYPHAPPSYTTEFENGPDGPRKVKIVDP